MENTKKENEINKIVYFLRKNKFYYESNQFHIGKTTQIVGLFENFNEIKKQFLEFTLKAIKNYTSNGMTLPNMKVYQLHKYLLFRNVIKKNVGIDTILNKNSSFRDLWDYNNYYMSIKTLEDVELFNMLYPTDAYEIMITNRNYLLSVKWNSKFFELIGAPVPNEKISYGEDLIDYFSTKGLFTDELDFWANLKRDVNAFGFVTSFYNIDVSQKQIIDTSDEWFNNPNYEIVDNKIKIYSKQDPLLFWFLNNNLLEPPLLFEKINLKDIREYEKSLYKDAIIEAYLMVRFVPAHFYTHNEMMNSDDHSLNFWDNLQLTEDFAKEVVNDNLKIINERASELEKRY